MMIKSIDYDALACVYKRHFIWYGSMKGLSVQTSQGKNMYRSLDFQMLANPLLQKKRKVDSLPLLLFP
jgi:hypothetical protein